MPDAAVQTSSAALNRTLLARLLPGDDLARLQEDAWGALTDSQQPVPGPVLVPLTSAADAEPVAAAARKPRALKRKREPKHIPTLPEALAKSGLSVVALGARAISARHYNAALGQYEHNKAEVNWSVIAAQLQTLLALALPNEDVVAFVDRQGGRKFYTGKIGALIPGAMPWVECETQRRSVYRLQAQERTVRIAFLVEGDGEALPVALASMAAKLTRELAMERLNAYFTQHDPEIKPTAGYYGDANRFLRQTQTLREKLGVQPEAFVRLR
jgi:hypothetical protein